MRIGAVGATNFMPFEEVEYDFSEPGLTTIEGEFHGLRGLGSNGAGKTALLDIPTFALFGRCVRKGYSGDDVIRLHKGKVVKGGCMTYCEIEDGKRTIRVERYRKHPVHGSRVRLLINGEDVSRGTNAATDAAIVGFIGMDFTVYKNSVAFGMSEDVKSFFSAPDAERKRILDTMLGLEVYGVAQELAKKRVAELLEQAEVYTDQLIKQNTALETNRQALADLDAEDRTAAKQQATKLKALLKKGVVKKERLTDLRDTTKMIVKQEQKKADTATAAYNKAAIAYNASVETGTDARAEAKEALDQAKGEEATLCGQLKKFEGATAGSKCPTCKQKLTEKHKAEVKARMKQGIIVVRRMIKKLQTPVDKSDAVLAALVEPDEPGDENLEAAKDKLREQEQDLIDIEKDRDSWQTQLGMLEKADQQAAERRAAINQRIVNNEKVIVLADEKLEELDKESAKHEFWVEGFGNQGIRSFLIEAEIPAISTLATKYARRLIGDGVVIRLRATTALKSKDERREKLFIEAVIPGCSTTYTGASKGQRLRLDLALLLAFREKVSERAGKPFNQLFADELFDGVDDVGAECVVDFLSELSAQCPVAMVTHNKHLKDMGDRVVSVYHDGTKAWIKK